MRAAQPAPVSPALPQHLQERSKRRENRVADQTTVAGFAVVLRRSWLPPGPGGPARTLARGGNVDLDLGGGMGMAMMIIERL